MHIGPSQTFLIPPPINSSTPSSSTNLPYKYEDILNTITELQQDLEKTKRVANTLKNENATLRKNYNDVQRSLERTQQRYNETRSVFQNQASSTATREQTLEEALVRGRAQLDKCTKELESTLRDKNAVMKNEEIIRNQVQKEIHSSFESKLTILGKEVSYRNVAKFGMSTSLFSCLNQVLD